LLLIAGWAFQWPSLDQAPPGQCILIPAAYFSGTKPFSWVHENILKQTAGYRWSQQAGDGQNAIHFRSDLDAVMHPVPRLDGSAGDTPMIEASAAILAIVSLAIFAAHALDAYRTG
jgi:hypothetical protein